MNRKLIDIIRTVAPTIATALGGPLAGMATRAVAGVLLGDEDASFEAVEAAINEAGGNDLLKLKELEYDFKLQMQQAGVKLERIAADDRDSARDRQVKMKDWTPTILGVIIMFGFFAMLAYVVKYGLPQEGGEVVLIMIGGLATMTTQVGNYFFGSSTGSKNKDRVISDLRGAMK